MMPKYKDGDVINMMKFDFNQKININDIVVFSHPFNDSLKIIKRITKIKDKTKFFVEGDNPDHLSTTDSHNFGYVNIKNIIAIKKDVQK